MAKVAKSVVDVVLGEAAHGTIEQRFNDMLGIMSVIANRAAALGVPPEQVVGVKSEFNAYAKALPAGAEQFRSLAQKAVEQITKTGPIHDAMFFATPSASRHLPRGLEAVASTTGHNYFSDPKGRAIKTADGYKMPSKQPTNVANAPIPEAAPRSTNSPAAAIANVANTSRFSGAPGETVPNFDQPRIAYDRNKFAITGPLPTGPMPATAAASPPGFRPSAQDQVSWMTRNEFSDRLAAPMVDGSAPQEFATDIKPTASVQQPKSAVSSYLMSAPEITRGSQRINGDAASLQHPQIPGSIRDAQVYANQQNAKQPSQQRSTQSPPGFRPSSQDQVVQAPPGFRPSAKDQIVRSLTHPQPPRSVPDAMVWANQQNASQPSARKSAADTILADVASKTSRTLSPTQTSSLAPAGPPIDNKLADAYKQRAASLMETGQLNLSGNKRASIDLSGNMTEPVFTPDGMRYAPANSTKQETYAYIKDQVDALAKKSAIPAPELPKAAKVASQSFSQQPAAMPVSRGSSAMDVWSGKASSGIATDGSTVSKMPDGRIGRYSPKYDHTEFTSPDGSFAGLQKGNQLSDALNSRANPVDANGDGINPFSGSPLPPAKSTAEKALASIFSPPNIGKAAGAVAGGLLAGPVGAAIGGKLGGKAVNATSGNKQTQPPSLMSILTGDAKGFPPAPGAPSSSQSMADPSKNAGSKGGGKTSSSSQQSRGTFSSGR